jgi:acetyltransferase-like isoleucine patch superfamily enzyme
LNALIFKIFFCCRYRVTARSASLLRQVRYRFQGMRIGRGTHIGKLSVSWPHQVELGADCLVENAVIFKFDGPYKPGPSITIGRNVFIGTASEFNITNRLSVGDNTMIASGCRFIDHDHGSRAGIPIRDQPCHPAPITIGKDCWIGANVVVLKGVAVGNGAVIGAGAVVNKSIPSLEIWGGVPARRLRTREAIADS